MRKLILILIIFSACQREMAPPEARGNGTDTTGSGDLLTKVVSISDEGDSSIFMYSYDSNKRMNSRIVSFAAHTSAGYYYVLDQRYYRDEAGRIIKIANMVNNTDTSFTEVNYEGATTRIMDVSNSNEKFEYDSLNRLVKIKHYRTASDPGNSLQPDFYSELSYDDKGNLLQKKDYNDTDNDGVPEPNLSYKFDYDDKVNPLKSHDDIFIITDFDWLIYSPNNVIKWNDVWLNKPTDVITYNFVYRQDGRPISCKHAFKDGETGSLSLIADDLYYYQ